MNKYLAKIKAKKILYSLDINKQDIQFQSDNLSVKIYFDNYFYWALDEDIVEIGIKKNSNIFFRELERFGAIRMGYQ